MYLVEGEESHFDAIRREQADSWNAGAELPLNQEGKYPG